MTRTQQRIVVLLLCGGVAMLLALAVKPLALVGWLTAMLCSGAAIILAYRDQRRR